tara:strand:+ start:1734 stop:2504 length:771 start_codon:yes stop_codon:yes gene_type:complete
MREISIKNHLKKMDIKKGDNVLVSSNLLNILIRKKKYSIKFNPNDIIDDLISVIGNTGTILIPTYNWDFCKGFGFDYKKTLSKSGSLGNYALKRDDFSRTKNPIYSFAVYGKKRKYLSKLKNKNCFSMNSPFGFLIKNNGKNLFIDIKNIYYFAFTFLHVVEQVVGVNYRFLKTFTGKYRHCNEKSDNAKFTMYARKLHLKTRIINPIIKKKLISKNAYREKKLNNINIKTVKMDLAYKILKDDIKNECNFIIYRK